MSLTQFIKRPAIRDAFKAFGLAERTPVALRGLPVLVADSGGPHGLAGTAFDFLARYHIVRECGSKGTTLHWNTSVIDQGLESLQWTASDRYRRHWEDAVAEAQAEGAAYIAGQGDVRRLADLTQYLARIDVLYRCGWFDPEFRPIPSVTDEIMRLLDLFDPVDRLAPCSVCLLNPSFVASKRVGGADADLVADTRLIDLKTTATLQVSLGNLLQLSGYAALQRMGGIAGNGYSHKLGFQSVEIYFARYGVLKAWTMDELFPANGFDRFFDAFEREIVDQERRYAERQRQFQLEQSERKRQRIIDAGNARIEKAKMPRDVLKLFVHYQSNLKEPDCPDWLRTALFSAVMRAIRVHGGAKGSDDKKDYAAKFEIRTIRAIKKPLELLRAFQSNEAQFTSTVGDSGCPIRDALFSAARRVSRKRRPTPV